MLNLPEKIVIFDTEYTAWPGCVKRGWIGPNEYQEVVQIGVILIDTKKFIELDSLNLFIKPVKNPVLSDYFTDLTGITQEEVDKKGISYEEAILKFYSWCENYTISSFGRDEIILKKNCKMIEIPFPFKDSRFIDIRDAFRKNFPDINKYQSGSIMSLFGKKSALHAHDGLNDVRIILEGLRELNNMV